jgi:hypothetical protein
MLSTGHPADFGCTSMPKGRTKFTKNLTKAINELIGDGQLGLEETRSVSLFSPVLSGDYKWVKVMDSDGLLVGRRRVKDGEGAKPTEEVNHIVTPSHEKKVGILKSKPEAASPSFNVTLSKSIGAKVTLSGVSTFAASSFARFQRWVAG